LVMISVRIDDDLKRKMGKFKHINWSEVIRQAINDVLSGEEARNLAKAVLLNERNLVKPDDGFRAVDVIRGWREAVRWSQAKKDD
jgi:Arc/MetJ-type ribon-helix-helix transcriptional regulator